VIASKAKAGGDYHHPSDPGGHHCFLAGTRIRTANGEVAIEQLKIGARVETLNGLRAVKWIGRRAFTKTSPTWHPSVAPIRVAKFALDDQYPVRDLYLSPEHSLFIDGNLIPVKYLVNGGSIAPVEVVGGDVLSYFHIELDTHEVIFAEGASAETLQVVGSREKFSNFVEYERMYGRGETHAMKAFAPVLGYRGGREELMGLLRLVMSAAIDVRDPIQRAYDRILAREELEKA
jgi:hypothetical protein